MLLIGLAAIVVLFTALWLVSLYLRNTSIVDIWWGPGILTIGLAYYLTANGHQTRGRLVLALVAIWAVRLALHIAARSNGEDFRYADWREEREDSWWWYSYIKVFLLQAVIAWVVAMPLYFAIVSRDTGGLNVVDYLGVTVFTIGFLFEAIADEQLRRFRNQPKAHQRVLDTGLWKYSRHPNYFGEAMLWWGLGLIGAATGGVVGLIGPLVITALLIFVSGVPLLEESLQSKPGYAAYAAKTPMFVPGVTQQKGEKWLNDANAAVRKFINARRPAPEQKKPQRRRY